MSTQTIIDNQISAQLEGRTDIRVECLDTSKVFNPKLYAQKKARLLFTGFNFLEHITFQKRNMMS